MAGTTAQDNPDVPPVAPSPTQTPAQQASAQQTPKHKGASSQAPQIPAGQASGQVPPDGDYRIDQVAARTGLTKRTLRYYEEIGLLPPPTRTEGGYRLYSEQDVQHLELIKRLRDLLGVSLAEIREMAQAEEERQQLRAASSQETDPRARIASLERASALARRQLAIVEEKLTGLQEMRATLLARLERQAQRRAEWATRLTEATASAEAKSEVPPTDMQPRDEPTMPEGETHGS